MISTGLLPVTLTELDSLDLPEEPESILILDPCSIKEAILSTPAYAAISRKYFSARRALVTSEESVHLFRSDPNFQDVIGIHKISRGINWLNWQSINLIFTLRKHKYDLSINLSQSVEMSRFASMLNTPIRVGVAKDSKKDFLTHRLDPTGLPDDFLERKIALLSSLGCLSRRRRPVLVPAYGDERYILDLLEGMSLNNHEQFIVIVPDKSWPELLPTVELAKTIDSIQEQMPEIKIFIISGDNQLNTYITKTEKACDQRPGVLYLSPNRFMAFVARCDFMIGAPGIESLIANAVGTNVFGLDGQLIEPNFEITAEEAKAEPERLVQQISERLADSSHKQKQEQQKRYYDSPMFRKTHKEANLFMHTAP